MEDLQSRRLRLNLSQSHLARISGVSRYKICLHELGDLQLSPEERERIDRAIGAEICRLQAMLNTVAGGSIPPSHASSQ
jgi:predicted transcriptional regulator